MSAWGADRFADDLRALGYEPVVQGNLVSIKWDVSLGTHVGETVELGWDVPTDWPETPPHGPQVKPGFEHPTGGNHESPFGAGWRHWSRPFNGWAATDKSMRTYLRFMSKLFAET